MAQRGGKREGAGRKKGVASILADKARNFIAEQVDKELRPIVEKAIEQAKVGDSKAREWLSERAWGKAIQAVVTKDEDGNDLPITGIVINSPDAGKKS